MEEPVEYNAGKNGENQLRIAIYETPEKIIEGGYGDFYNTLDRKTAIEKMAKAICNLGDEETWKRVDFDCQNYCRSCAEHALKALLGE